MSIAHTQPQTNSRAVGGEASPAAPSRGVSHLPQVNPATIAAIARSLEQAKAKAKKKAKKHSKRYTQYKQTAMFVQLMLGGG
ncbi:MAG: hypothetical protein NZ888_08295, partial [Candidatus Nitrosocaldus sp.]|nr:hypothetical protein [Candidatus Nitrosocaldus sp.]MDW8001039.1 hypothetical protein [Candidatus Nitrosocaldus sp.]